MKNIVTDLKNAILSLILLPTQDKKDGIWLEIPLIVHGIIQYDKNMDLIGCFFPMRLALWGSYDELRIRSVYNF